MSAQRPTTNVADPDGSRLQKEFLGFLFLLERFSRPMLQLICRIVQNDVDEKNVLLLTPLMRLLTADQIRFLSDLTGEDRERKERARSVLAAPAAQVGLSIKDLEDAFKTFEGLMWIRDLCVKLSVAQAMKLFEVLPPGLQLVEQLQTLQFFRDLLCQLPPEYVQNLHNAASTRDDGSWTNTLTSVAPGSEVLAPSVKRLLQLSWNEVLTMRQALSTFVDQQFTFMLQLLHTGPNAYIEIRNALASTMPNSQELITQSFANSVIQTQSNSIPVVPHPPNKPRLHLQIVEQPPDKSVYKRNLKPNPSVMVVGDSFDKEDTNLVIGVVLVRTDNFQVVDNFLTGNQPQKVGSGRIATFRKLKVLTTSHQQNETHFILRFELRRYQSEQFQVIDSVNSAPICVLSHSTQMKTGSKSMDTDMMDLPMVSMTTTTTSSQQNQQQQQLNIQNPQQNQQAQQQTQQNNQLQSMGMEILQVLPVVTEVIPPIGATCGGTRVAIIGSGFLDSPTTRVRFDNTDVMPTFHSNGTLVCHTPEHLTGVVTVRVCNVKDQFSQSSTSFKYDDSVLLERTRPIQPTTAGVRSSVPHSGSADESSFAAWRTDLDSVKRLHPLAHN